MKKKTLLSALALVAAFSLASCVGPSSSNAFRHNEGVPVYNLGGGYGGSHYSSSANSAPC